VGAQRPHPALERCESGATGEEATAQKQDTPDQVGKGLVVVLDRVDRVGDDLAGVREHVDEDERQHADCEHRERDAGALANQPHAADRQP
jgi:hypothetical protein